jgi:membrane protease YdiL (CAAX protease family)
MARKSNPRGVENDEYFDPQTTVALIGGQSALIVFAAVLAAFIGTPNLGLGPNFSLDASSVQAGCLLAVPLGALAGYLDTIEDRYPMLQDVTRATQRSVLSLLGGRFKPLFGLVVAIVLGIAAGVGEEMLFRGLLQFELISRTGLGLAASLGLSSLIFGLLHAVTPLYAIMAALASVYFGLLYIVFDNLAVPIACHSLYDIGALLYAHWTVSRLTDKERAALASWNGPTTPPKESNNEQRPLP